MQPSAAQLHKLQGRHLQEQQQQQLTHPAEKGCISLQEQR
jgi:hypothetical protein